MTEYHPGSSCQTTVSRLEECQAYNKCGSSIPSRSKIIYPFRSRADFEFAELVLEAALNRKQIEQLISISNKCLSGEDAFTFKDAADLEKTWAQASLPSRTPVAFTSIKSAYPYVNMYPGL